MWNLQNHIWPKGSQIRSIWLLQLLLVTKAVFWFFFSFTSCLLLTEGLCPPKFTCPSPNPQCDDILVWSLWEIIRWSNKMGFLALEETWKLALSTTWGRGRRWREEATSRGASRIGRKAGRGRERFFPRAFHGSTALLAAWSQAPDFRTTRLEIWVI